MRNGPRQWKIGEVAESAHVTVRTLHHYDEIGLLVPSGRTEAGYRLYSEADVERLFRILLYRELGLPLESIARVMDDPTVDRGAALRAQRALLLERRRRTDAVIRAVDRVLETMEKGSRMSTDEMWEGFDAFAQAPDEIRAHQAAHGQEASERWGGTVAFRESIRRARGHGRADWERIRAESGALEGRMAALMAAGADPAGEAATGVAEEMRRHVDRWFYPCDHAMHAELAGLYLADPRFAAHYEERAPGLAGFVAAAVRANAARGGAGS